MNKTALQLAYDLINLSQELEDLNTQKNNSNNPKLDMVLDTRIDATESEFFRVRDILGKINV